MVHISISKHGRHISVPVQYVRELCAVGYLQPNQEFCICEALAPFLHQLPHPLAWAHPSRRTPPLAAKGGLSLSHLISTAPPLYAGSGRTQEEVRWVAIPLHSSKQLAVCNSCKKAAKLPA